MSKFRKFQLIMGSVSIVSSALFFWLGYADEANTVIQELAYVASGLILFSGGVFMVADVLEN